MQYVFVLLVAAAVFGICYLVDKGFTKLFRSQQQHQSGLSVRHSKHYGSIGLVVAVLGLAAVFSGIKNGWVLIAGGAVLIITGIALVIHYLSFGVYYDEETFLVTSFRGGSKAYRYGQIKNQQLYNANGSILIELHMDDGTCVHLQSTMVGVYPFMDKAFAQWCEQTGRDADSCAFHDPARSCWFPPVEE